MNACLKLVMLAAITSACCFDALQAQDSRIVVLSSKVGADIDKEERSTYRLFPGVVGFYSAVIRHEGDSSFVMSLRLDDGGGGFRDSLDRVTFRSIELLAEKIDYHDALMNGGHVLGTGAVRLRYADGSPVVVPNLILGDSVMQADEAADPAVRAAQDDAKNAQPQRLPGRSDRLPLAPNKHGLRRPEFGTYLFSASMDYMSMDIGEIESLPGDKGSAAMGFSLKFGIVLLDEPSVRLLGGWSFSLNHDVNNYSIAALWQPISYGTHGPIIGMGLGRITFDFSGNGLDINGAYTYPAFIAGWAVFHPNFDLLLTLPVGKVTTTFEDQKYTISPAGPTVSLMFSL